MSLEDTVSTKIKRFWEIEEIPSKKIFARDAQYKQQYVSFLNECKILNHITLADDHKEGFFLFNHAIFKDDSLTKKLRVVFDEFAKSTSLSLNHTLLKCPVIQDDLTKILTGFRFDKFVITADIAKMLSSSKCKRSRHFFPKNNMTKISR